MKPLFHFALTLLSAGAPWLAGGGISQPLYMAYGCSRSWLSTVGGRDS